MLRLSPAEAREHFLKGGSGPVHVDGVLDLNGCTLKELPPGIRCYELHASDSAIQRLPDDIAIENRLVMDNCVHLEKLPAGLVVGSIRLRNCPSLEELPEGIQTWFLDLSQCQQFHRWPAKGQVHCGKVLLRNCASLRGLPDWMGRLSHLDISGCPGITTLPPAMSIAGWIDLAGSGVREPQPGFAKASLRWNGVIMPEVAVFHPERLKAAEVLAETNAEVRRVMIERMGYLRFAEEANAKVLHKDTDPGGARQLLRIELNEDEPLVGLVCNCPSTGRQYFLRVPPATTTCHQAAAWIAGFDNPALYHPLKET